MLSFLGPACKGGAQTDLVMSRFAVPWGASRFTALFFDGRNNHQKGSGMQWIRIRTWKRYKESHWWILHTAAFGRRLNQQYIFRIETVHQVKFDDDYEAQRINTFLLRRCTILRCSLQCLTIRGVHNYTPWNLEEAAREPSLLEHCGIWAIPLDTAWHQPMCLILSSRGKNLCNTWLDFPLFWFILGRSHIIRANANCMPDYQGWFLYHLVL